MSIYSELTERKSIWLCSILLWPQPCNTNHEIRSIAGVWVIKLSFKNYRAHLFGRFMAPLVAENIRLIYLFECLLNNLIQNHIYANISYINDISITFVCDVLILFSDQYNRSDVLWIELTQMTSLSERN